MLAALAVAWMSTAVRAEDDNNQQGNDNPQEYHTFKSVLSTGNANWCIDIPGGNYQAGAQLRIASCTGAANQTFSSDEQADLLAGGLCLGGDPGQRGRSGRARRMRQQ